MIPTPIGAKRCVGDPRFVGPLGGTLHLPEVRVRRRPGCGAAQLGRAAPEHANGGPARTRTWQNPNSNESGGSESAASP